jgi:3-oxoacyl-[acyl-carrier-protein] synthase II
LVILESLEHAKNRGARIYAEVIGFGAAANTFSWSRPDPQGRAIETALNKSLADANLSGEAVDLVNPFGTGVAGYDTGENTAWNKVFGPRLDRAHALCTRGALGNNGAGAGAIDFAATIMALHRRTVPPSVGTDDLEPDCRFRFVQNDPIDARIEHAVSIGFALAGGQAAALVIRRFQE